MNNTPRIYVACLASYNAGKLHGRWIDCDAGEDHILEQIAEMLAESPEPGAEEWAVHDHEGFGGMIDGEWPDLAKVAELGETLANLDDESEREAFTEWVENGSAEDYTNLLDDFRDDYRGTFDSLEQWAEEFARDTGFIDGLPEPLRCYFDADKWALDCELGGDIWTASTSHGVAVFDNR